MDLSTIRAALEQLPETCLYHGDQLDPPTDRWPREACCDTGVPALRRRKAMEALDALDALEAPDAAPPGWLKFTPGTIELKLNLAPPDQHILDVVRRAHERRPR